MKKLLSVLLALALALSLAMCAAAKEPPPEKKTQSPPTYQDMEEKMASAVDATPSLTFELPNVTAISAVWDGETLLDYYMRPYFSSENVEITVTFDDATTETLDIWSDEGNGWYWFISYGYNEAVGKVTFYYEDSNFWRAYRDSLADSQDFDWDDFLATLPQMTLAVGNLLQEYMDSQVKTELKLGESKKVAVAQGERKVLAFKPEKGGLYYIYSENRKAETDPFAILLDGEFCYWQDNDDLLDQNFGFVAELEAGTTYYLIVSDLDLNAGEFDVAVSNDVRMLSAWQWLREFLAFGFFRRLWVKADDYYNLLWSIPSKGNWLSNMTYNLLNFAGVFVLWLADLLYR